MKLLYGDVLWNLVWLIPLFLILPAFAASRRKKISALLFPGAGETRVNSYSSLDKRRRAIRTVCLILSVLCALIAAAGPAWGRKILPDAGPGHDLLVLFDVSRSMLADDVKPSRLAQGKWLVRELVKLNPEDRFGLIAFAGTAFLQCPLTIDKTSFLQLTDALDTDTIALGGTNIQAALETAVKAFEGAEGNHKAVILITDGDELTGRAASVVKQLSQAGIPLFIAGIGDPGNPSIIRVTAEDGSKTILKDEDGNTVKSPLNEAQLAELARNTSGIYVRSTVANPGLDEIENGIRRLELKRGKNILSGAKPIERAAYPLAASLFFLFLFFSLSETRKKTTPASRMPLLVFCLLFPVSSRSQEQKEPPHEPLAVQSDLPASSADKTVQTARDHFNAGLQAHRKKELETARTQYEKSITMENDPNVRAAAYQNMGAIHHQEARDCMTKANELLKNQKLDESEKNVDLALAGMEQAEADYKENLLFSAKTGTEGAVRNQQMLLHERKDAQELKKEIEKLKKLQEEARKQTQKAHDQQKQQKQQNQQQKQDQQKQDQQKQDQQKQDQQKQDQQKQDQQNQDQQNQDQQNQDQQKQDQQKQDQQKQDQQKQEQQEQNRQETKQAEEQVRDLRDQARKLEQSELEKKAEEARRELEQAQKSQNKGENQKAEEHLKKALEALGGEQDRKEDKKDRKDQSGKDDKKDRKKQEQPSGGEKDKQEPQKKPAGAAKPAERPEDIDPKQAEAILDAMARDEKELRDMLKEQQKRNAPAQKPQKDW